MLDAQRDLSPLRVERSYERACSILNLFRLLGYPQESLSLSYHTMTLAQPGSVEASGKVRRQCEGYIYIYKEYWNYPWPTLIIYWPPNTRSVYLAPTGQEDGMTILIAMLLPRPGAELHLTYDYRLFFPFCPLEEFFTLRVARIRIFAEDSFPRILH